MKILMLLLFLVSVPLHGYAVEVNIRPITESEPVEIEFRGFKSEGFSIGIEHFGALLDLQNEGFICSPADWSEVWSRRDEEAFLITCKKEKQVITYTNNAIRFNCASFNGCNWLRKDLVLAIQEKLGLTKENNDVKQGWDRFDVVTKEFGFDFNSSFSTMIPYEGFVDENNIELWIVQAKISTITGEFKQNEVWLINCIGGTEQLCIGKEKLNF